MPTFTPPALNLGATLPVLIVAGWATILLLIDLFIPRERTRWTGVLAALGVLVALAIATARWNSVRAGQGMSAFGEMLVMDPFAALLNIIILVVALISILFSLDYLYKADIARGEYYPLLLFSISGMMLMAMAADLIVVFLALELLSIPLYILSGFARPRPDSEESAMKYFLLGAFSSAFLIYGIALVYGATGSTMLSRVMAAVHAGAMGNAYLLIGAGLILVGLSFKVAAVPFHMWTPDVYEGAPTSVTGFMSVGAKAGGFAAMLRIFLAAFPALAADWVPAVAVISALTMILGNFVALAQSNIKRMLAYSSIAHAGYIMMAVAAGGFPQAAGATSAALFYLLAYTFTNLGAFAVVVAVEREYGRGVGLNDYAGLAAQRPWLALAMAFFMLSLTGVPPTAGFTAKLYVFRATLEAGLLWLAIIGVLTSVISAYFYLRVVVIMFMREGSATAELRPALSLAIGLTALGTLILGITPEWLFRVAQTLQPILPGS
jgi:NADH-quinone oxidoreductase subunit N